MLDADGELGDKEERRRENLACCSLAYKKSHTTPGRHVLPALFTFYPSFLYLYIYMGMVCSMNKNMFEEDK